MASSRMWTTHRRPRKGAELNLDFAASYEAVPYHPGAVAYFADKGITVNGK